MFLGLKPWKSSSLPDLPRTKQFLFTCHDQTSAASLRGGGVFVVGRVHLCCDPPRARVPGGPIRSVVIHAVYLINAASKDPEIRAKSLASLTQALQVGDAIGADGVVFHPGSAVGEPHAEALERVGEAIREVLAESDSCPLLLEDTAGAGGTLGRDFGELARLIELGGGHERLRLCGDPGHGGVHRERVEADEADRGRRWTGDRGVEGEARRCC